jgi:2-amino-4-hydroxy-6-hydroxymethyldihydropteridine diphosphokinase
MNAPHVAWIGLGSNLDAPGKRINAAITALARRLRVLAVSARYRTTPVGGPSGQPDYCNAAAAVVTGESPLKLLELLQATEADAGRVRTIRWGPRTLDLDLLAFDDLTLAHPRLQLPHPRAHTRAFVLVPLAEIAPALELKSGRRVIDYLAATGTAGVTPWSAA